MTFGEGRRNLSLVAPLLMALVVAGSGCSSDDSGSADTLVQEKVTVSLGQIAVSVPVSANVQAFIPLTLALPPDEGIRSWSVDVTGTLAKVHVVPMPLLTSGGGTQAAGDTIIVGLSEALPAGTVCNSSVNYMNFTVTLDANYQPTSASPAKADATPDAILRMDSGPFTICVRVTFPIFAEITVDALVADVTRSCNEQAQDQAFLGFWSGTYSCQSKNLSCSNWQESGPVSLTITYDATTKRWTYVDEGNYRYEGSVCGKNFRFVRNDASEIERGKMILGPASTSATKTSRYYLRENTACWGECIDQLTRG
jgi:hypothetical protein